MAMTRQEKESEVAAMQEKFSKAEILLLTINKGLNAKATNDLRVATRAAGVDYRVAKNTMARIAAKGTAYEALVEKMKGPVGYVTGTDGPATAKVIAEFAKKNDKLVIIAGKFGDMIMDEAKVKEFATLPTMDEIRSKLVGLLQAPASRLVGVTKAYGEKEGGTPAPKAEEAAAPAAPDAPPAPEAAPAE